MVEEFSRHLALPVQLLITRSIQFTIFIVVRYYHEYSRINLVASLVFCILFGGGMLIIVNIAGYAHRLHGKVLTSFRVCSGKGEDNIHCN